MARNDTETIDPGFLLLAYSRGLFPMASGREGPIEWHSPDPRGIIELEDFRIPRSLRQVLRKGWYVTRVNTAFEEVVRSCADRSETWISEGIVRSYSRLHALGFAHSVETWEGGELAGGLYGVSIGGAFFGESMFSRKRDASKVALVALVERLRERGYVLLDTQFLTPHLARFGGKEVRRNDYLERLQRALALECSFA